MTMTVKAALIESPILIHSRNVNEGAIINPQMIC